MARPTVRISLKTKNNFEALPGTWVDLCALWDGQYGVTGSFSDGKYIGGSGYGYRIDSIDVAVNHSVVTVTPDQIWLNGKVEDDYVSLWMKSRDTKACVNLLTATDGEYGLSGQFDPAVRTIRFTMISDSGNEESFTVTTDQVFVNGKLDIQEEGAESSVQPAETPAMSSDIPF